MNPAIIVEAVKQAGPAGYRIVDKDDGKAQVEVSRGGEWAAVGPVMSRRLVEAAVREGVGGRVILG